MYIVTHGIHTNMHSETLTEVVNQSSLFMYFAAFLHTCIHMIIHVSVMRIREVRSNWELKY